jgi:hypothetical protein
MEADGFPKDEFLEVQRLYTSEHDSLQTHLSQIDPPALDSNTNYQELQRECEALQTEKRECENRCVQERADLEHSWQTQIEDENDRHRRVLPASPSGRNRDQVKQSLQRQIDDLKRSCELERDKSQQLLENERTRASETLNELLSRKMSAEDQTEIADLQQELHTLEADHRAQLEGARAQMSRDIGDKFRVTDALATEYRVKIEQQNRLLQELMDEFTRLSKNPEDALRRIHEQWDKEFAGTAKEFERLLADKRQEHGYGIDRLKREAQDMRGLLQSGNARNQQRLMQDKNEKEGLLEVLQKKLTHDLNKRRSEWEGLLSVLTERIEVLAAELDALQIRYETRDGRQSDRDEIESLTGQLRLVSTLLAGKLKDCHQFKTMIVEQEKVYNSHFGKSPSVGILQFIPELRPTPRSARL